jgi:hypothetical protein
MEMRHANSQTKHLKNMYTAIKDILFALLIFSIAEGLGNSGYLLSFLGSELRSVFYKFTYVIVNTQLLDIIHMDVNLPQTARCQHLHTWE